MSVRWILPCVLFLSCFLLQGATRESSNYAVVADAVDEGGGASSV